MKFFRSVLLFFSVSIFISAPAFAFLNSSSLDYFAGFPKQINELTTDDDLPNPFTVIQPFLKKNNYITPLLELKANEEKYLASPKWKSVYLEMMVYLEGYVGNYEEAYKYENALFESFPNFKQSRQRLAKDITGSPLADYKMLDALDAIESAAADQQVVMINEEHRTPFHRAMTLQLLPRLYAKGFRYFAAETVDEKDTELNKRGFPTQNTGFYTADPLYADVIRTALKLGYKVVSYEGMEATCKSPAGNPEFCNDQREREQAQNLYNRILKNDPQAKILVHVGRSHNSKSEMSKEFNFMAYYFKKLTNIEPFSIDQLHFSERYDTADEQPLYRFLTKNDLLNKPSVYRAENGKFYNETASGTNMVVFHPRMTYENGRATFLRMNGLRKVEKINLKKLKLQSNKNLFASADPVLIQAFYADESTDAVPVDQIILYPNKQIPVLMLPKGKLRIKAIDKSGKEIREYAK